MDGLAARLRLFGRTPALRYARLMLFCQSCGAKNSTGALYCNQCGSKIAKPGEAGGLVRGPDGGERSAGAGAQGTRESSAGHDGRVSQRVTEASVPLDPRGGRSSLDVTSISFAAIGIHRPWKAWLCVAFLLSLLLGAGALLRELFNPAGSTHSPGTVDTTLDAAVGAGSDLSPSGAGESEGVHPRDRVIDVGLGLPRRGARGDQ